MTTIDVNRFDFTGESYADYYPNLHPYPATMLPQIGYTILKELDLNKGSLLDPYCGSGSSFTAALEFNFNKFTGCDLNPLALLICKAKFTAINPNQITKWLNFFEQLLFLDASQVSNLPNITNASYWFDTHVFLQLGHLKNILDEIDDLNVRQLFYLPFMETVRKCSYTRQGEFKLYRISDISKFSVNVLHIFLKTLRRVIKDYTQYYLPKILINREINFTSDFKTVQEGIYDVVLTSPPYGDSKTTVAYGQFSIFANEWLGITTARQIDKFLMGGKPSKELYQTGIISSAINSINNQSNKRALEISSFYFDLEQSIKDVANRVKSGGTIIYIVGNRTVKQVELPTNLFIAEKFVQNGFEHITTHKRKLSNKVMPSKNSPTNQQGQTVRTMLNEYIVVCKKN